MPENKVLPAHENVKIKEIRNAMQRVERARAELRTAITELRRIVADARERG